MTLTNINTEKYRPYCRITPNFFVHYFLIIAIIFTSGCWPAEEKNVQVQRVILHPSAEKLIGEQNLNSSNLPLLQASGWLEPDPYEIRIPCLVDGVIDELLILEGEAVTLGQRVATLIDDDAKLSLSLAQANYMQSKAREQEIDSDLEMLQEHLYAAESYQKRQIALRDEHLDFVNRLKILPHGAIAQVDINQSIIKLQGLDHLVMEAAFKIKEIKKKEALLSAKKETQKAMSLALKVGVEKANLDLNRTVIYSPADGVIIKILTSPGMRVMSSMDSPDASSVAVLFEKGKLLAGIDVPLAEASKIFIEQDVQVICSLLPDTSFAGKVTRISGMADIQRNTIKVNVRLLDPDDRLRPEMLCRAKFLPAQTAAKEDMDQFLGLMIPVNLISDTNVKDHQLFVVSLDGKRAEVAKIKLGEKIIGDHISVISGLKGGEQIIANPPQSLRAGDRIKISN